MKMKALALALALSMPAAAQVITIDNEVVTGYEIVEIRLKSVGTVPPVEPPVEPPIDPNPECGAVPRNVTMLAPMDWSRSQSKTFINLQDERIRSSKFVTTNNPDYLGQIGVASVSGGTRFQKHMWLSQCPGGEALPERRCDRTGGEGVTINWGQNQTVRGRCHLYTDTIYYWNVQTPSCPGGNYQCNANRAGPTNKKPWL